MTKEYESKRPVSYADAGVDVDAGNRLVELIRPALASTKRAGADGGIGGFGGLFDLKAAGFDDPILVGATDGVGTKLKVAVETGVLDTIGIDLVAMCVNDLIVQGAEPLFFLDYYSASVLDPDRAAQVISGIAAGCRQAGAALIGGETAEMPGLYQGADFDLAGFAVGAANRTQLLPRADIKAGDAVLALASNGLHSNGYSLVRHLVTEAELDWDQPAPFAPEISLGRALLVPTRIYVRSILQIIKKSSGIKALAHITGGGLTDNIPRVLPADFGAQIDFSGRRLPAVFSWLRDLGRIDRTQLLRTFNCGIGMIVIAAADQAGEVERLFGEVGEDVSRIGEIVRRGTVAVDYSGDFESDPR